MTDPAEPTHQQFKDLGEQHGRQLAVAAIAAVSPHARDATGLRAAVERWHEQMKVRIAATMAEMSKHDVTQGEIVAWGDELVRTYLATVQRVKDHVDEEGRPS